MLEVLEDRRVLASFTVVSAGDAPFGSCTALQCTLRDAVIAANGSPGADTIQFAPAITGTITLAPAAGALVVTGPVTIDGPGSGSLSIEANTVADEFRVFDIEETAGDVTIEGVTITGGRLETVLESGGGIRFNSPGTLTIQDSIVTGNQALNGGGIASDFDGTIEVIDSDVSYNESFFRGGGISNEAGDVVITRSNLTGNVSFGSGAGIFSYAEGDITVTDSTINNNTVTEAGYIGGGIYSLEGDVTISGSTISGNLSAGDAGGLYSLFGTVDISDSTFELNIANYSGGAIFKTSGSLTITDSAILSNAAVFDDGGGIVNLLDSINIIRSTIQDNIAGAGGGGLVNSTGVVTIDSSTFALNSATGNGGGILSANGPVTLTNSTVSVNDAGNSGGGIASEDANVTLVNSTLVFNFGFNQGGGIEFDGAAAGESLTLLNSVVANNVAITNNDFTAPGGGAANLSVLNSFIGNNDGTGLTAAAVADADGNIIGTLAAPLDPMLDDLGDYGGTTQTHLPLVGSPLIDAGRSAGAPTVDQRGVSRPIGPNVDMGSVEAPQQIVPAVVGVTINEGTSLPMSRSQITSVTIEFDTLIDSTALQSAFQITNFDTGQVVNTLIVGSADSATQTTVTLTFGDGGVSVVNRAGTGLLGNSLADGNYVLDINSLFIVAATGGSPMAADYQFGGQLAAASPNDNFFRIYGDADGSGVTETADLNGFFVPNFFGSNDQMDANGDGVVETADLNLFFVPNFFKSRL